MTREEWLLEATRVISLKLKSDFNLDLPAVKVSCGFTGSKARKANLTVLGSCWIPSVADDNIGQIYISPTIDNSCLVLGVLTHELVHALTPGHGHKGEFRRIAKMIGLEGKMTEALPGESLQKRLNRLAKKLGDYPHSKLNPSEQKKKQSTRMLKAECAPCDYKIRASRTTFEKGIPDCPCCGEQLIVC